MLDSCSSVIRIECTVPWRYLLSSNLNGFHRHGAFNCRWREEKNTPHTHTQIQRVREKEKNILLVTFSARSAGEHSVSRYLFKSRANHNYIREKRKNGDLMSISTSDILKFQPADGICHFNWSINLQNCKRK